MRTESNEDNNSKNIEGPIKKEINKGYVRNQDYIESVAAALTGVDKKLVKNIFDAFWDTVCDELEHGNTVKLHGKGQFYLSRRSRRIGRNPATGKEHIVPEREAMAFQTSPAYAKKLRERRLILTGKNPETTVEPETTGKSAKKA